MENEMKKVGSRILEDRAGGGFACIFMLMAVTSQNKSCVLLWQISILQPGPEYSYLELSLGLAI